MPAVKTIRALGVASLTLCLCSSCGKTNPVGEQWAVMGTVASVSVSAENADEVHEARTAIANIFDRIETDLSTYRTHSLLSIINQRAGSGQWTPVTDEILELHLFTKRIFEKTDGAFDPTVGPLMDIWGFRSRHPLQPPPQAEIRKVLSAIGYNKVECQTDPEKKTEMRLPNNVIRLDYGGIAKGYAVDLAYNAIANKHHNLLINLAGNMRAKGSGRSGNRGWNIAIRDPFNRSNVIGTFSLTDGQAVATSGNYERFVTLDHKRYAHIMDPRSGTPVQGVAGVTVIAKSAVLADALSTAIFVAGPDRFPEMVSRFPNIAALMITDSESPKMFCTHAFIDPYHPLNGHDMPMIVVDTHKSD